MYLFLKSLLYSKTFKKLNRFRTTTCGVILQLIFGYSTAVVISWAIIYYLITDDLVPAIMLSLIAPLGVAVIIGSIVVVTYFLIDTIKGCISETIQQMEESNENNNESYTALI